MEDGCVYCKLLWSWRIGREANSFVLSGSNALLRKLGIEDTSFCCQCLGMHLSEAELTTDWR